MIGPVFGGMGIDVHSADRILGKLGRAGLLVNVVLLVHQAPSANMAKHLCS